MFNKVIITRERYEELILEHADAVHHVQVLNGQVSRQRDKIDQLQERVDDLESENKEIYKTRNKTEVRKLLGELDVKEQAISQREYYHDKYVENSQEVLTSMLKKLSLVANSEDE